MFKSEQDKEVSFSTNQYYTRCLNQNSVGGVGGGVKNTAALPKNQIYFPILTSIIIVQEDQMPSSELLMHYTQGTWCTYMKAKHMHKVKMKSNLKS